LPISGGGLGTIKVVGKGVDAAADAGKLAGKTPTHPEFSEHVIGGDFNARSRKVTGGHSLLNGDVRTVEVVSPPDVNRVYEAIVEIRQPNGKWAEKKSPPDQIRCSRRTGAERRLSRKLIPPGKIKFQIQT